MDGQRDTQTDGTDHIGPNSLIKYYIKYTWFYRPRINQYTYFCKMIFVSTHAQLLAYRAME